MKIQMTWLKIKVDFEAETGEHSVWVVTKAHMDENGFWQIDANAALLLAAEVAAFCTNENKGTDSGETDSV